jgi:hypothetical protein
MPAFRPPFCPNPSCPDHRDPSTFRFVRWGHFLRTCPVIRRIPRYRCSRCRRTFSSQTFETTYWLRRPELQISVAERLLSGSGYRQVARFLGCSPSTVMGQAARLGRHAMLFQELHRPKEIRERLALDGFESFAFSQYYPLHLNLSVGAVSHFVYALTESELRRKGRMTKAQRVRRGEEELAVGRPDPRAIEKGVLELLEWVLAEGSETEVHTDDHPAYPRAIQKLSGGRRVRLQVTSSRERRTTRNPLFPVNRQDLMLRHTGANHRRETIAFSKLRASVIERGWLQVVFMNFLKPFSEKRQDRTPAQRLGIVRRRLTLGDVLRTRLFATRIGLGAVLRQHYERRVPTRRIPSMKRHALRYAY